MAPKSTIKKAVCNKCGHVASDWYVRRKHGYSPEDCGGEYVARDLQKDTLTGDFEFVRSYGNIVYIKHIDSGREVNIYTVDLLKVLAGRGLGKLTLTESKRGREHCWKAEEVTPDGAAHR